MRILLALLIVCLSADFCRAQDASPVFPKCNDSELISLVKERVDTFQQKNPPANSYQYRKQRLTVKNISDFEPLDIRSFKPSSNYKVADRIITLKINGRIPEDLLRLCRGADKVAENSVYLLMYPEDGKITVDIINFQNQAASEALRFSYPQ